MPGLVAFSAENRSPLFRKMLGCIAKGVPPPGRPPGFRAKSEPEKGPSDAGTADGFRFVNGRPLPSSPGPILLGSPMLIVCPNCTTCYRVEASLLGAAGRSVRCVRCRNVWFAHDPTALTAIAQAHRSDVKALAASITVTALGDRPPRAPLSEDAIDGSEALAEHLLEASMVETEPGSSADWPDHDLMRQTQAPIVIADAPALAPMEQGAALPADAELGQDFRENDP